MRRPVAFTLMVCLGIAADQLTKFWVFAAIPEGSTLPLAPNLLHATPHLNTGAAFSLFGGAPWVVLVFSLVAVPVLACWYALTWKKAPAALLWCQGLLLSGAAGNMIDRLALGHVRDFMDFRPDLPLIGHWAVFNAADVFITCGVILFVIAEFLPQKSTADAKEKKPAEAKPAAES
ncbi:MAG: signal peptidase II [Planctomycetes bacterium]|nr:signal peptidase II [Planctomycetota bacterium]